MTSWQKDLEAMRNNPQGWRYAQVARVLERSAFALRGSRGTSHRTWVHPGGVRITVVDAGNRAIKAVYVVKAVEAIDQVAGRKP